MLFSKGARELASAQGADAPAKGSALFDNLRAAMLVPEIRQRVLFVFFAFAWFVFMIHVQLPERESRGVATRAAERRVL